MGISRARAKGIHECVFYALWGTGVACVAALVSGAGNILSAGLIVSTTFLFCVWLLLPPIPKNKPRKKSRKSKTTSRKRRR